VISYLDESNLKEAIKNSEAFARPFQARFNEEERVASGLPGRVPKGKPRITENTTAATIKEASRRAVPQLPTGKARSKNYPDLEQEINAVLTDDILPHANSGGKPRTKFKNAAKRMMTTGSAFAYCFYNRRGDWFGADFKLVNPRDVRFEQGKTSEFDSNTMFMDGWYTLEDLKTIKKQYKARNVQADEYEEEWDIDVIDELIKGGEEPKDDESKSLEERIVTTEDNGYIKLTHCFQVGVGAKFYAYSAKLDKIAKTCVNKDPRGIIPIHAVHYEEDFINPYGQSLVSLSLGKQNLLDFLLQLYMYNRGYQMSPTLLNYGSVQKRKIRIAPDTIIDMGPASQGNKLEALNIDNSAIREFPTMLGLLKSQMISESGMTSDTSVSASVGNPGFSKTDAGVDALQERLGVAGNDIRKNMEDFIGRVYETLLNLHFAHNQGKKQIELQESSLKRMKLKPGSLLDVDYDSDYGPIEFTVDAGTTEAADNERENQRLVSLLELTSQYGGLTQDKQMMVVNQIIQNSGVDDPERLMYSDDEIELAVQMVQAEKEQQQMALQNTAAGGTQVDDAAMTEQPAQQGMSEEEMSFAEQLTSRGVPDEDVATAITMLRNGYTDEEVFSALSASTGAVA
jgi:hypothetical protein